MEKFIVVYHGPLIGKINNEIIEAESHQDAQERVKALFGNVPIEILQVERV